MESVKFIKAVVFVFFLMILVVILFLYSAKA